MPVAIATVILGAGASALAIAVTAAVVSVGISYVARQLFTPGGGQETSAAQQEASEPSHEQKNSGILLNKSSNSAPVPVIYGYRKVGGSVVFRETTGNNKYLWLVLVIGEGEIEGISNIYLDNEKLGSSSSSSYLADTHIVIPSVGQTTYQINSGKKYRITQLGSSASNLLLWRNFGGPQSPEVNDVFTATDNFGQQALTNLGSVEEITDRFGGTCEFVYRTGTNDQSAISSSDFGTSTDPDLDFPSSSWDGTKRLFGLAHIMCKFTYDKEVYRGIPTVHMDVKGIKVPNISPAEDENGTVVAATEIVLGTEYRILTVLADSESTDPESTDPSPNWLGFTGLTDVNQVQEDVVFTATVGLTQSLLAALGTVVETKKWNRNPAAIMYDYLTNSVYGRGIDPDIINVESFIESYETCETALAIGGANVPAKSIEGITNEKKLYRLDGVINVDRNTFDNTKRILSTCRAYLIFSAGKYSMLIDKFEEDYSRLTTDGVVVSDPVKTPFLFSESNMVGGLDITLGDKSNTFNRARYSFSNPQKNWKLDTVYFDDKATRNNRDRGVVLEQSVSLELVASKYCAYQIVKQNLKQSRQQIVVSFEANISALSNNVGDIVDLSNENAGWDVKQFRILKMDLQEDGNVKIVMLEYSPTVYNTSVNDLSFEGDAVDTNLPDPFSVSRPIGLVVTENQYFSGDSGAQQTRASFRWNVSTDPFVSKYEVQYRISTGVDGTADVYSPLSETSAIEFLVDNISPGYYDFRVRSVNDLGVYSDFSTLPNRKIAGLTTPPSRLENFSVRALDGQCHLSWDKSEEYDVLNGGFIRIRHSEMIYGASWVSARDIGQAVSGNQSIAVLPLLAGTYLAKTVDSGGRFSEYAALAVTTVPNLDNLNVVREYFEHRDEPNPRFHGTKVNMETASTSLKLVNTTENATEILSGRLYRIVTVAAGSESSWLVFTGLTDANQVQEGVVFTALADLSSDNLVTLGAVLDLNISVSSGTYDFSETLDLGHVYTSRVTARLSASSSRNGETVDHSLGQEGLYTEEIVSGTEYRILTVVADSESNWFGFTGLTDASQVQEGVVFTALANFSSDNLPTLGTVVETDDTRGYVDNWVNFDGQPSDVTSGEIQIRTSQYSPEDNDWSDWIPLLVGDFHARAFEFRLVVKNEDPYFNLTVTSLRVNVDMPDRVEREVNLQVDPGGRRVSYGQSFLNTEPSVGITMNNASSGDYFVITGSDETGFHIRCHPDGDANYITKSINWQAHGYGRKINGTT